MDIAKLMEDKIPPSTIMQQCFGPDSDEDPAVVDAFAAGDGAAVHVGLMDKDENANVVDKNGDNVCLVFY